MVRKFITAYLHDLLYDLSEYRAGKLRLGIDIIFHYSIWFVGFLMAHLFLGFALYYIFFFDEFYKFIISLVLLLATFVLLWWSAAVLYGDGDRPTVVGINDPASLRKLPVIGRWL